MIFQTNYSDNGKFVERQRRKAMGLSGFSSYGCQVAGGLHIGAI